MNKSFLASVAAVSFALASPAFGQDPEAEMDMEHAADEVVEETEEAMDEMADTYEDMEDEATEAYDDLEDEADEMADDVDEMTDDAAEDMDEMADRVTCPEGTDAQADGSCLIVGDWNPED
jgi:methyl-accepting chemotaxis protein